LRGQGTYLSDDEINRVIAAVATSEPQFVKELVQLKATSKDGSGKALANRDELYEAAVDLVIREGRGSVSLLQRALGIGYGRAARLVDFMAEDGIVGQYNGSQAREVLISLEQWAEMTGQKADAAADAPAAQRSHKILIAHDQGPQAAGPAERLAAGPGTPGVRHSEETPFDSDDEYEDEEEVEEEDEDLDEEEEAEDDEDDDEEGEDEVEFDEAEEEEASVEQQAEDLDHGDSGPVGKGGTARRGCA
jgi:S-DNA-T family DNA segregation ATPase FtsK/SpoIIIE